MRPIHYIIALFLAIAIGLSSSGSHPVQGTAGYTGAPGDAFCSTCHSPNASINGTVQIGGLPAEIVPGQTYNLTVTITRTAGSPTRGGFQLLVLNGSNQNSGNLFDVETDTSVKTVSGGKKYSGHEPFRTFPGSGVISWQVDWQAPPTNATGQAKFYVAGMFANGNMGSGGDRAIAFSSIVPFQSSTPDPITLTITNIDPPSCSDTEDGSATVNILGGTPPYNILWNNGETTAMAISLPGGTASVTVTDSGSGSSSRSTTLVAPAPLTLTVNTTNESCFGEADGTASATSTGGTGNKTYTWSNGGTGSSQNNFAQGFHGVTVTDANGCSLSDEFFIDGPDAILINVISLSDPSCFDSSDGSVSIDAEGGSGNFSYVWSNGATGSNISNIPAGSYTVTVTDGNGCQKTSGYTLQEPLPINISFPSVNNVTCNGLTNGSATAQGSGGNGNYTYDWSNGASGRTVQNLAPGTYQVTVIDLQGCSEVSEVDITEPEPIQINEVDIIPASCSGANDGGIIVEALGPQTSYNFLWSNGITSAANLNIAAGTYTVTATDPIGCTASKSFTVGTNAPFSVVLSQVSQVTCFGLNNGSASVNVTPSGNYTYLWSNGATTASVNNVPAGSYSVIASDDAGCESSPLLVLITQPAEILPNLSILENIDCFGDQSGSVAAAPAGGAGSFTLTWSNGLSLDTLTNLSAGTYSVTIVDGDMCSVQQSLELTQPPALSISVMQLDTLLCYDDEDGIIALDITGGTGDIEILWSTGDTTPIIGSLGGGNYSVSVTDENLCILTDTFVIVQPDEIAVNAVITPVLPDSGGGGSITLTVSGGEPGYSYVWSNGELTKDISELNIGVYTVTVTDDNGCQKVNSYLVSLVDCNLDVSFTTTSLTCFGENTGQVNVEVNNALGNFTATLQIDTTIINEPFENLGPGMYTLQVVDSAFCSVTFDSIIISQPDQILVSGTSVNPTPGNMNGSIEVAANGGTGTLTFTWFSQFGAVLGQGNLLNNLGQGLYFVEVVDENGCKVIKNFLLQEMVSTSNPENVPGIILKPNPASENFVIELSKRSFVQHVTVRDILGKQIIKKSIDQVVEQVLIDQISAISGLYLVEIHLAGETIFKKILINH
ncbi:MAG: T9SS type A sorting domain-containing protein [Saprospiraceae bacterium]|nr:T9SS type A sorting domain-containing protein [Saprospiraceae bacterium]